MKLAAKALPKKAFEPGWSPLGKHQGGTLMPGKGVQDRLLFEVPTNEIQGLRLELPAGAFGGQNSVRLQIPRSMISIR